MGGSVVLYSIQSGLSTLPSPIHISSKLGLMSQVQTRSRTRSHEDCILEDAELLNGWAMPLLHCVLVK